MSRLAAVGPTAILLAALWAVAACAPLGDFVDDSAVATDNDEPSATDGGEAATGSEADGVRPGAPPQPVVDPTPLRSIPHQAERDSGGMALGGDWLVEATAVAGEEVGAVRMVIDPDTGSIASAVEVGRGWSAGDVTAYEGRALHLVAGENFAVVFDSTSLAEIDRVVFDDTVAGICSIGSSFVTSNGTPELTERDRDGTVRRTVTAGANVNLSTLACSDQYVFAVVAGTNTVAVLEWDSGQMVQILSLDGSTPADARDGDTVVALAYRDDGVDGPELFVTGRRWDRVNILAVNPR